MAGNPKFRLLYVIWAFFEIVLFGGLLFGWGSLVFILKEDSVFSYLCSNKTEANRTLAVEPDFHASGTNDTNSYRLPDVAVNETTLKGVKGRAARSQDCPERDERLFLAFTIGSMIFCAGCAAMGQISFKFGTRVTRLCALVSFLTGSLLTGFTSEGFPWLIFPGLSLLGIGGIPLLMTNTQFSVLFTRGSSTVVSLMSGAFDASAGVMVIVKLLYEKGVPLKWSMVVIACLHLLTLVNTFCFLPRNFISKSAPSADNYPGEQAEKLIVPASQNDGVPVNGTKEKMRGLTSQMDRGEKSQLPSVRSCILSPVYLLHVIWFSILQLRFYYFLSSLNTWLTAVVSKEQVSYFTNVLMYTMTCGFFTSVLAGIFYDFNKRFFFASKFKLRRDLMPAVFPLALAVLLGIILSVLVLIQDDHVLYLIFIFVTIFRSSLYSFGTAYISVVFPTEYFGVLYGLMIVLGGVISLAQYGFFSWAEASGFAPVNQFLTVFVAVALVHPAYQWFLCRREESKTAEKSETAE